MLRERDMAMEALVAFEETLKKQSHRLGATLGAAKAANIGNVKPAKSNASGSPARRASGSEWTE